MNFEIRNAIKLNKKIHQLKIAIIKIAIMTYFDLIKVIIFEIFQQNFDDENFDSKNELMTKTFIFRFFAIINSLILMTKAFVFKFFSITNSSINQQNFVTNSSITNRFFVINSSIEFFDQIQNDTLQYSNFLFRIQTIYKKNSILQTIIKIKNNNNRKISIKLIKKNIRLKLNNCKIKFDLF